MRSLTLPLERPTGTAGVLFFFANRPAEARRRTARTGSRVERRRQTNGRREFSEAPPSGKQNVLLSTDFILDKVFIFSCQLTCSSVLVVSDCSICSKRLAVSPPVVSMYMTLCFRWWEMCTAAPKHTYKTWESTQGTAGTVWVSGTITLDLISCARGERIQTERTS